MTLSTLFSHLDKMETGNQCVKFIDLLVEHGYLTLRWFCPLSNTNFIHFSVMRKIESEMVAAIYKNKNWKSGNTMVMTDDANISRVFLHGNHIATIDEDSMMIMDGGWQSKTTKSRLNALCEFFCYKGECVFQKDFKWYVRKCIGAINGENVFKIDEFHSGYTFAWSYLTVTSLLFLSLN